MSAPENPNQRRTEPQKTGRRRRRGRGKPASEGKGKNREDPLPRDQRAHDGHSSPPYPGQNRSERDARPVRPAPQGGSTKSQADARTGSANRSSFKKDRIDKDRGKRDEHDPRKDRGGRIVKELSQPTDKALREQKAVASDFRHIRRRYGMVLYDHFAQAKSDLARLQELEKQYDQLNIVIRAEGNMDDPDLTAIGRVKVFAGAAWTLIHERRKQDGWYEEPR